MNHETNNEFRNPELDAKLIIRKNKILRIIDVSNMSPRQALMLLDEHWNAMKRH